MRNSSGLVTAVGWPVSSICRLRCRPHHRPDRFVAVDNVGRLQCFGELSGSFGWLTPGDVLCVSTFHVVIFSRQCCSTKFYLVPAALLSSRLTWRILVANPGPTQREGRKRGMLQCPFIAQAPVVCLALAGLCTTGQGCIGRGGGTPL